MHRFSFVPQSRIRTAAYIFLVVFVLAFGSLPRFLALDEARWFRRSAQFMSVIKKGEFTETPIAYHPGVATITQNIRQIFE